MNPGDIVCIKTSSITDMSTTWFKKYAIEKKSMLIVDIIHQHAIVLTHKGSTVSILVDNLEVINESR